MKKLAKLITLMLACILLIGAAVGISVAAADAADDTGLTVKGKNVAYNAATQLCVAVDGVTNDNKDSIAMLFWDYNPGSSASAENATSIDKKVKLLDDRYYFLSYGVDAKDMSAKMYFATATLDAEGNVAKIGAVCDGYSIVDYAIQRLTEQDGTAAQNNLYAKLIAYAGATEAVLGDKQLNFALVETVDGYVGKYDASILGAYAGDSVLLRAEAKNADGEYFLYWEKNGTKFSDARVVASGKLENGKTEFTAVYGNKASSAYATTYDFEALSNNANGILMDPTVPTSGFAFECWDSVGYKYKNYSEEFGSFKATLPYSVEYAKVSTTAPEGVTEVYGTKSSKDYYATETPTTVTADRQAKVWVDTNEKTGDKSIVSTKFLGDTGMTLAFANGENLNTFEFDISISEYKNNTPIQINLSNSARVFAGFSLHIDAEGLAYIFINGSDVKTSANAKYNGVTIANDLKNRKIGADFKYDYGSTMTLKFVVDTSGTLPEVDVYVDGAYYGTAGVYKEANGYTYYDFASRVANTTYDDTFVAANVFQLRASTAENILDNVTFLDEEPYVVPAN